jgi:hypothetical protein
LFNKEKIMKKTMYLYRLTDARGDQMVTVVDDPTDNGTIGGYDSNGQYQQYDSYELYYAYEWAEKHGFKLESGTVEIDVTDAVFQK